MYTIYPLSKDDYIIKSCDRKPLKGLPGPKTKTYWITIPKKRLEELITNHLSSLDCFVPYLGPLDKERNQ